MFEKDIRMRRSPDGIGHFIKKTSIKGIDLVLNDTKYDIRLVLKSENQTHFNSGFPRFQQI